MDLEYYHISPISSNSKVGPLLTTTNSRSSCPNTCRLKGSNGCYGENYPLVHHWNKVSRGERGHDLETHKSLLIKYLAKGDLWRSCQVGDMPHDQGNVDTWKETASFFLTTPPTSANLSLPNQTTRRTKT